MAPIENPDHTQEVILKQLALIEQQLNELMQEKMALQRLLLKARRGDRSLQDVSRKNSLERILIEGRIIDKLSLSKRSVPAAELYKAAKEIKPDLKDNTFRSYLKRMADRDLIQSGRARGSWELPKIPPTTAFSVIKTAT